MNLHEFYIGIKSWRDEDLYACLAQIDVQTDTLYPLYHELSMRYSEDDSYVIGLNKQIEEYELMSNIINRELENR